jgi:hypothetical protein
MASHYTDLSSWDTPYKALTSHGYSIRDNFSFYLLRVANGICYQNELKTLDGNLKNSNYATSSASHNCPPVSNVLRRKEIKAEARQLVAT